MFAPNPVVPLFSTASRAPPTASTSKTQPNGKLTSEAASSSQLTASQRNKTAVLAVLGSQKFECPSCRGDATTDATSCSKIRQRANLQLRTTLPQVIHSPPHTPLPIQWGQIGRDHCADDGWRHTTVLLGIPASTTGGRVDQPCGLAILQQFLGLIKLPVA